MLELLKNEKTSWWLILIVVVIIYLIRYRKKIAELVKKPPKLIHIVEGGLVLISAVAMITLMLSLNTDKILASFETKVSKAEIEEGDYDIVGKMTDKDVEKVADIDTLREKGTEEFYTLEVTNLEPTKIYMLRTVADYGKKYHYRADPFFKDMYTKNWYMAALYKDSYGQLYVATLTDNSRVLVFLSYKDKGAKKTLQLPVGIYQDTMPTGYNQKLEETISNLDLELDGYVNMCWFNRDHPFALVFFIIKALGGFALTCMIPAFILKIFKK